MVNFMINICMMLIFSALTFSALPYSIILDSAYLPQMIYIVIIGQVEKTIVKSKCFLIALHGQFYY